MSRASIASILGLGGAALVASRFEGTTATGIVAGYLLGSSIALLCGLWVGHAMRYRPERALHALLQGFGVKAVGLIISALCLKYIAAAAAVADWRSFVVTYTAAAVMGLFLSTLDNTRSLRGEAAA